MSLPAASRYRILLAEDHALVRDGIRMLLALEPDLDIVGEAADGERALALALEHAPDLVVLDLALPKIHGIEVARRLKGARADLKILVLTGSLDAQAVRDALAAGAEGYVLKQEDSTALLGALRTVLGGGNYVSASIAQAFDPSPRGAAKAAAEPVTAREREILQLIARGGSSQAIARQLFISVPTVRKHRENLMRKLNLHNAAEVTAFAMKHGFYQSQ